MSHMICKIHAYDVMGEVFVHAQVIDADLSQSSNEREYHHSETFTGTGEDRPDEWLRDVLIALLEGL